MGLLDNYTGIGMSPRPTQMHQGVMICLSSFLYYEYADEYATFSESCIDPDALNSPAPDIILFDRETDAPVLFIEITTSGQRKAISEKIKELMRLYPTVKEAYMYDYETKIWRKYADRYIDTDSYSDMLDMDLDTILNENN